MWRGGLTRILMIPTRTKATCEWILADNKFGFPDNKTMGSALCESHLSAGACPLHHQAVLHALGHSNDVLRFMPTKLCRKLPLQNSPLGSSDP